MVSRLADHPGGTMANTVFCHYRVASGNEAAFERLLREHWPTLHRLGLVTNQPSRHFKGEEQEGGALYIEIFDWLDGAAGRAHEHPEVMAIWEPMDQLCEPRHGKPRMEFPHLEPIDV
jgi:hypothetical protein